MASEPNYERQRAQMVQTQLRARGIRDARVLEAMGAVPRERFVPWTWVEQAYEDRPLPIDGATISQPYIVALMTELARVEPGHRVLEVGTGSGYQAAILDRIGAEVFTIEVRGGLAREAERRLAALGYTRTHVRAGNGWAGWSDEAPFDAILITAAAATVPPPLLEQLADGGRLVAPIGPAGLQDLVVYHRQGEQIHERRVAPVAFVPFVEPTPATGH